MSYTHPILIFLATALAATANAAEYKRGDTVLMISSPGILEHAEVISVQNGRVMTTQSGGMFISPNKLQPRKPAKEIVHTPWFGDKIVYKVGDTVLTLLKGKEEKSEILDIANGLVMTTSKPGFYYPLDKIKPYRGKNAVVGANDPRVSEQNRDKDPQQYGSNSDQLNLTKVSASVSEMN